MAQTVDHKVKGRLDSKTFFALKFSLEVFEHKEMLPIKIAIVRSKGPSNSRPPLSSGVRTEQGRLPGSWTSVYDSEELACLACKKEGLPKNHVSPNN